MVYTPVPALKLHVTPSGIGFGNITPVAPPPIVKVIGIIAEL